MAVVFGTWSEEEEGWLDVSLINYKMESHENGYIADEKDIPTTPRARMGIGYVQMYHPKTKTWKLKEIDVPYTKEESLLEIAAAIRELAQAIKEK